VTAAYAANSINNKAVYPGRILAASWRLEIVGTLNTLTSVHVHVTSFYTLSQHPVPHRQETAAFVTDRVARKRSDAPLQSCPPPLGCLAGDPALRLPPYKHLSANAVQGAHVAMTRVRPHHTYQ